jgi:SAM-dependent methyltransferase
MNQKNLSKKQIMNRIYKDICGFNIPKRDELKIRKSKGSPIYGEINHQSINKLLDYLKLSPHDVFFDLGSGVGKVVLHTALFSPVKKAVGIELSEARYNEALLARKNAKIWEPTINKRCKFINADLMTVNLSSATVIYTCSTAFSMNFMRKIVARLRLLKQDFVLVTLQDLPDERHFELIETLGLDMSWIRKTPVYIYRRLTEI